MVLFRYLNTALLLLQVFTTRASQATFIGLQEHLDSGQQEGAKSILYDSSEEKNNDIYEPYYEVLYPDYDEETEETYDSEEWRDEEADEDEAPWWYEGEDESFYLPLSRVRRRIIPVGKALERDRISTDRSDPYDRHRSPWAAPPKRDPVIKRSGPTGSAALFSLYPELATPEWRETYGIKAKPKRKREDQLSQQDEAGPKEPKERKRGRNSQKEEINGEVKYSSKKPHDVGKKKAPRRKLKLSKEMKEEIAKYAQEHGVEKAVADFKDRVNGPLRVGAVNKFLRRYKNRLLRRGNRQQEGRS